MIEITLDPGEAGERRAVVVPRERDGDFDSNLTWTSATGEVRRAQIQHVYVPPSASKPQVYYVRDGKESYADLSLADAVALRAECDRLGAEGDEMRRDAQEAKARNPNRQSEWRTGDDVVGSYGGEQVIFRR